MRRFLLGCYLVFNILLFSVTPGSACGDKVLALGRALKLRYLSAHSTSILIYARNGSAAASAMTDPKLQSSLKQFTQTLKYATSRAEFEETLAQSKYDLIITDASDAAATEQKLHENDSHAVVVPVLNGATKAEASALAKQYHVVLKTPGKPNSYLSVLDHAMEMKAKRDEIKILAKK